MQKLIYFRYCIENFANRSLLLLKNKLILALINSYKCKNKFVFGIALIFFQIKVYFCSKINLF